MNVNEVANQILKNGVRLISKMTFEDEDDFKKKVNKFITSVESELVFLKLRENSFRRDTTNRPYQHWKIEFEIIFRLDDLYIDSKIYDSGSVYIFPSKKAYDDIYKNSISMLGARPEWNNTRTIATVTGKARDY